MGRESVIDAVMIVVAMEINNRYVGAARYKSKDIRCDVWYGFATILAAVDWFELLTSVGIDRLKAIDCRFVYGEAEKRGYP